MSLYTGNKCPACGKLFEEQDDIVVCPICGSPHHRACYKELGHCGNEHLHAEDKQWESEVKVDATETEFSDEVVCCSQCGERNPKTNIFCQKCGAKVFSANQNSQSNVGQTGNPYVDFIQSQVDYSAILDEGVTVGEAADFVGPNNLSFILKFKAIAAKHPITFNWSAFFFSFFYCFHRKMYKVGWALIAIFLLLFIPTGYYASLAVEDILYSTGGITFPIQLTQDTAGVEGLMFWSSVTQSVTLITRIFCGFFFNKLYYNQMIRKIKKVKATAPVSVGAPEYRYAISLAGGVNRTAVPALIAAAMVLYIGYGYFASMMILK